MSRHSETIVVNDVDNALVAATSYLDGRGYKAKTYKGEQLYQKGSGIMVAPSFVKIAQLDEGTIILEAWIKYPIIPGILYVGEMGLKGFIGAAPKRILRKQIEDIRDMIYTY